jgi:transposase-like protein
MSHGIYLYNRSTVGYWDVEEMLARRGIVVSYETIRRWCREFGPHFSDVPIAQPSCAVVRRGRSEGQSRRCLYRAVAERPL